MKKRIMFLDDDRFSMAPYVDALQANGYDVDFYIEPADALSAIQSGKQYDLMIVDLLMRIDPDELPEEAERAGIRFVTEVKTHGVKCPVIFLTVLADEDIKSAAKNLGKMLTKPVSVDGLLRRIREALK